MDVTEKARESLRLIGEEYHEFLRDNKLQDTILARMTYLNEIKKEYLRNQLETDDLQKEIIRHLTIWMDETQREMNAAM